MIMNTSILETAKQIRYDFVNNKFNKHKYIDFNNKYPKFYMMLQKKDMDEEMFNKLLELLSTQSTDDQNAASEFSQYGAEKYLYPQFGKPSLSDLKTAQSKIDKLS